MQKEEGKGQGVKARDRPCRTAGRAPTQGLTLPVSMSSSF